ncbi:MAG: ATP synthase F1 subunit gamma [Erysipelotrichaceae bacterium]|nr:ATP synthase F1 subunit gamma [Erysipelotrichaceae bacterium]MBR2791896.1 ATP synthase F1 subunit gamma [Erysipelotrichaceae bacterium]
MAGQISNIRRQLKSVKATQKITNAMALVATAKLQKQKGRMTENNTYSNKYYEMILNALSAPKPEKEDNAYLISNNADNPLHIIITSNSGLCGSYNNDLLKYVEKHIDKKDPIFAIGEYGIEWLDNNNYMVIRRINQIEDVQPAVIGKLINDVLVLYRQKEISSIDIVYTQYINTLSFEPSMYQLLPLDPPSYLETKDIEMVPDRNTMLNYLIPQYVSSVIYATFLEAKTSENAARRSAMDNANKNAQDLIERLSLEYNQARQTAITQEVNEITAGADAL